jgi:iron complex outermembrane recepter protein
MRTQLSRSFSSRFLAHCLVGTVLGGLMAASASAQTEAAPAIDESAPLAEETGAAGEDIIVTAQRRAESIQDVPIAISAVSGETMDRTNVRGIEEIVARAPNVTFTSSGSRDRKEISIRGVGNLLDPYTVTRPATYAFYIDEFNVVVGTNNPNILDLERFEVLRGPQGTYFGRNSIGGAFNVSTRKPTDEWYAEFNAGYSSFDTKRGSAIVNIPVAPGILALRASGLIESSDGNIRNIHPAGGGNGSNYKSGRVVARFTPLPNLTSDTTFSYSRERTGMRGGVPTGFLTATWRNVYYGGRPGLADPDGVGFYPENDSRVNFNSPMSVGTDFWYLSNRTAYDFDTFSIVAVGGYLESEVFGFGDVDGSSRDYFTEDQFIERSSKSIEIRAQSSGNRQFEWSIGANIGKDSGDQTQVTRFGTGGLFGRPAGFRISDVVQSGSVKYKAVFGQGTFHVTDQLALTAGGRYSHEDHEMRQIRFSNQVLTDNVDRDISFKNFSPMATITFEPSKDAMIYAKVARGFKSGGLQTAQLLLRESFDPETLWNYEAGFKFEAFDRRLRADVSAFYVDWKGVQQAARFQFVDAGGVLRSVNGIDNAESAESYGIDGSADFRVNRNFTLSARVGWLKSRFTSFPNALIDGLTIDISDKPLLYAPRWTLGGDAEYRVPVQGETEVFARAEWNYRSSIYSNVFVYRYETYPFISPSYHHVNLRLGVENETFRLVAYVENALNEKYFNNSYEKAFYSGVQVEPSVRRFGISGTYKFF